MRVTVETMPGSSVELDIIADEQEFDAAKDRAYQRLSPSVSVAGFRPGKAPRAMIEQRIGRDSLLVEAQRDILEDLYRRALEQEKVMPVAEPEISIYQDEPFAFKARVQVYPTIRLGDYRSLRIEPRAVSISDADVNAVLDDIRERAALWVEPEEKGPPVDGDQVTIDLSAFDAGEPFHEPLEDGTFVVGEDQLFTDIEEQVKLLNPGDSSEFNVTFDADDEMISPEIRGKTLLYKLTLKEAKKKELPEINDELAKSAGEYETLDELKASIRQELLYTQTLETRSQIISEVIEKVAEGSTFDVAPAMVSRQIDEELERLKGRLQLQRTTIEEYLRFIGKTVEEYTEELRPEAERRVRNLLIIEAIGDAEGIRVTDEEILAQINNIISHAKNPEEIKKIYSSGHYQGMVEEELRQQKVIDRLLDIVTDGRGPVSGEGGDLLRTVMTPPEATEEGVEEPEGETDTGSMLADTGENVPEAAVAETDLEPVDKTEKE